MENERNVSKCRAWRVTLVLTRANPASFTCLHQWPLPNTRISTKRCRLPAHFPAFVCRDWIQSAPFFQQIVCPVNCINLVLADRRSQRKEWLGRKRHQAEERRGRVTDAKLVWWEVSEKMSRETSFNRSWCLAAARLTSFEHKGDLREGLPPGHRSTATVLVWCGSQEGIYQTDYVWGKNWQRLLSGW